MRNHYSNLAHAILKGGQLNVLQKGPTESSNFAATWPMLSGTTLGLVTTICPELKVTFDDNMLGDQDDGHEDMPGAQDDFCQQR